jgi:hypothetical protein
MRDLLYKNLTSEDRRRKIISSSEIVDKQGVRSVVHRHFSCIIKEADGSNLTAFAPSLHVLKQRDTKLHEEHFFCKMKACLLIANSGKLYNIYFIHTLNIHLSASVAESTNL